MEALRDVTRTGLLGRPVLRQFVKFCLIGVTSMVIDVSLAWLFTYRIGWHWALAQTLSFSVAVSNGYVWNSLWTFRGLGTRRRHEQYLMFVAVNIVGLALNLTIMKSVFFCFTGRIINQGNPDPAHWWVAKALAIVLVSLWNFLANRHWTFAHRPVPRA
ncbi:MAG: GtrA family protein [Chthonomonadales bacterium]|nr:GtrA family protein [Chthonomonadales bacterium]